MACVLDNFFPFAAVLPQRMVPALLCQLIIIHNFIHACIQTVNQIKDNIFADNNPLCVIRLASGNHDMYIPQYIFKSVL